MCCDTRFHDGFSHHPLFHVCSCTQLQPVRLFGKKAGPIKVILTKVSVGTPASSLLLYNITVSISLACSFGDQDVPNLGYENDLIEVRRG